MTTQSLGGEELIYKKYEEILQDDGFTICGHVGTSLRFGIANGTQFFANGIMFSVMFYRLRQDPTRFRSLLESLFIILLAVMGNLNSMTYLADIEKAVKSCKKIFAICENESKMIKTDGPVEIDNIGDIEFKDVGFC
jgi:hypothetical protein